MTCQLYEIIALNFIASLSPLFSSIIICISNFLLMLKSSNYNEKYNGCTSSPIKNTQNTRMASK